MRNFSPQTCRSVLRHAVLFSVLAGLLFSCGEGIRLFPFPPADAAAARDASFKARNEGQIVYQKNVHRFENKQESRTKFGRQSPPQHWAGVYDWLSRSSFTALAFSAGRNFPLNFQFAKSIEITGFHGSRAPPPVSEFL